MKFFICAFTLFFTFSLFSQDKLKIKFGDISPKDFETKVYAIDSAADAVIIADVGSRKIEGNTKGGFSSLFKRYRRVHLLSKNAFDLANVNIEIYNDGDNEELLEKVKAVTYNLENGKVVETKLDVKSNIYKDVIDRNLSNKKFTLPNVKEGSIIEIEYTIKSDFYTNIRPWIFHGDYPCLWSEYNIAIPEFLGYVSHTQGYRKFDISERKDKRETFVVIDRKEVSANDLYSKNPNLHAANSFDFISKVSEYRFVMKDVPVLREEGFTSSINNHISKIEFHLDEIRPPFEYKKVLGTWKNVAANLWEHEYFGKQVTQENGWLKEVVSKLKKGSESEPEMIRKVYAWVRDNFTCTGYNGIYTDKVLKNVLKDKNGSVAELNLLITAMLKYLEIDADPVIVSTRSNGFSYSLYPLLHQYNYVITRVEIEGKEYFLDASEPTLGFGHLPLRCYNGHARVINRLGDSTYLNTDSINEVKTTSIFIVNDEKGNWVGSKNQTPGYYESYNLRNKIKDKGKEQFRKDIISEFDSQIEVKNMTVDSLNLYDDPITLKYELEVKNEKEDIIYLNPMFGEGLKENPLKSAVRLYPVEMPYKFDDIYTLQIEIPKGYEVDELPKSIILKLNEENEGSFEYTISKSGANIAVRSRLRISRTVFQPEEYELLREFFNLIIKKHAEQIVFKKK